MTPANDNQPHKTTAAIPLAIRLARAGRHSDLQWLIAYGRVSTTTTWLSADGFLPEMGSQPQPDRVVEIRPSEEEIVFLAAGDAAAAHVGYGPIAASELDAPMRARLRVKNGVSQWRGSDNCWRNFAELFRQPKGARRKSEKERQDDNARHLALPATSSLPKRSAYIEHGSSGKDYWRLRHAYMLQTLCACNDNRRAEIDQMGVGGRHTFDEAWANAGLYPACRIPRYITAIARGAEFLAYRVHSNPLAAKGSFVGAPDAVERQIVETIDVPRIDAALGEHGRILDLSIAGMTAREIAAKMGWGDTKHAERKAVAAQDRALQALAGLEEKMAA